jgi:hypothetical protein
MAVDQAAHESKTQALMGCFTAVFLITFDIGIVVQ